MEIEVGEYIRTENGIISKVINSNYYMKTYIECENYIIRKNNIIKHSKNIIDLIEEGDYVNGKLIHKVDIRENSSYIYYGNCKTFVDYQIKSIVTKETYKNIEYRLE